jgi:dTDP-4-dehydrorhamnose reductase
MYDGNKLKFSSENSKIFINNYYTKTKIMSEKICLKNYALVFRINFFGYTKKGVTFSNWVVKNFKSKKKFFLVDDVYFNPLGLTTIGQIILKIVNKNLFSPGIYNLGTNDQISKKDFAINFAKISNIFKYNFDIKKINELVKTKRSKNMSMNTKKFETKFNIKLPKILNEIKKEIRYTKL